MLRSFELLLVTGRFITYTGMDGTLWLHTGSIETKPGNRPLMYDRGYTLIRAYTFAGLFGTRPSIDLLIWSFGVDARVKLNLK
jgi:hypothetical protein